MARMARKRKRCVMPFPTFCEEIQALGRAARTDTAPVTPALTDAPKCEATADRFRHSPERPVNGALDGPLDGASGRGLWTAALTRSAIDA